MTIFWYVNAFTSSSSSVQSPVECMKTYSRQQRTLLVKPDTCGNLAHAYQKGGELKKLILILNVAR